MVEYFPFFLFFIFFYFYEATVCKNGAFFASWYSVLKKKKEKKREKKNGEILNHLFFEESDYTDPILETLHWLPVTHRIQYKITTIRFNSISGIGPQYLSDLLQPYTPARQLRSASDTRTFVTPRVNTKTFGEKSFSYAGPSVWNNLPQTLRHSDSASTFKAALKTHLFHNPF